MERHADEEVQLGETPPPAVVTGGTGERTVMPPLKVPVGSQSPCVCMRARVCRGNAYPSADCFKMQYLRDASGVTSNMLYSQVFYGYS